MQVPNVNNVSIDTLMDNPYPAFETMRNLAPVVWIESANIYLVTSFDEIMQVERHPEIFTSTNPVSLMNKVMGHSLMRKDGQEHKLERSALEASFRPGTVKRHWEPLFRDICDGLIAELLAKGNTAELLNDFAAPMSSKCLMEIIGLKGVVWQDLAIWSQSLMDAVGNYGNDPTIHKKGKMASDAIDVAIDEVIDDLRMNPDFSAISSMLHAETPLDLEQIRANVKVIVGGGLNEPRDAILTAMFGLLSNPEQRKSVEDDPSLYPRVFEESVRWISPIGMYPRRVSVDAELGGVSLKAGRQLGVCVGAANRDPDKFENPDNFDIFREKAPHLGFGAGPHFCAGTWVAKMMVGAIAVPELMKRLPNLELSQNEKVEIRGWVFRGPVNLPVIWN